MTTANPETIYSELDTAVRRLNAALLRLQEVAQVLQPPTLDSCDWYDLLRQKLLPQLGADAWLVAAVVGGTNIGKSVIFNHLAGCRASSTSPLASGTKHPVCLVPKGFTERHDLQGVFPDFDLHEWSDADHALRDTADHELYWRPADELPGTLLVLDTPDIDSDTRVNWVRADAIRRSADVLIAVLTQQKYNDAAVKEFFRKAAAEDKAVMVVFNQCLLPDDEQYWPIWLDTFCNETGIQPESVYLAPADRKAAEALQLPFYERDWPMETDADRSHDDVPRDLRADLAKLRFREIRLRTLRGSIRKLLDGQHGVPGWLAEIRSASAELRATSERLSSDAVLRIRDWPVPPASSFVSEIRTWWRAHQEGWARRVNTVYDTVGKGLAWPFRAARNVIQGEPADPVDEYRDREWSAILTTIEELFDKLQWMSDTGNRLVKPRIDEILQGASRVELIRQLRTEHAAVDIAQEMTDAVHLEMKRFSADSPEMFKFYRQLSHVSAAVRPMTSVVLFSLGFGPAGETVAPFVADAAANMVVHVVADVAGGATAAAAGEAAVGAAGTGAGLLQTWFHGLSSRFTERRVEWLTAFIRRQLLGTLPEELNRAAAITESSEWQDVEAALREIERLLNEPGAEDGES